MLEALKRVLLTFLLCLTLTLMFGLSFYYLPKNKPPGREVKEERVINLVESIRKKAKISEKIKVFALPGHLSVTAEIFRAKDNEIIILTGEELLGKWPDEALKGLFAHELAHFLLGHIGLVFKGNRDLEAEADAEVIKLVGKDALWSSLRNYMEDRIDRAEKVLQKKSKPSDKQQ